LFYIKDGNRQFYAVVTSSNLLSEGNRFAHVFVQGKADHRVRGNHMSTQNCSDCQDLKMSQINGFALVRETIGIVGLIIAQKRCQRMPE
jgi:hypothetical protein